MTTYTDRSRILTYQRCKRERLLEYHSLGTGVRTRKMIIPLTTGIAIHDGVTRLLKGEDIEQAIKETLDTYTKEVKKRGLEIRDDEDELFVFNEQLTLIEALIRVYEKIQLSKILEEYEVLEVEKEIIYPLTLSNLKHKQNCIILLGDEMCNCPELNDNIILMSKPDVILRDKSTNNLVIYSLKTSSSWTDTNEKQNKYDDQGISELIATEYYYNHYADGTEALIHPVEQVEAIKMDFLIKGQRTSLKDDSTGGYKRIQNSPLVHPYAQDAGFTMNFSLKYTKAKGWYRINIWEEMSIKEWVEFIFDNNYDELDAMIKTPYPYVRDEDDIQDWFDSTIQQETEVKEKLDKLRTISPALEGPREVSKDYRRLNNQLFPKIRGACFSYGRFCSFVEHCWGGVKIRSSEFEARVPHHETELINITKD